MKVIFHRIFDFFAYCNKSGDREKHKTPQKTQKIGNQIAQFKCPVAQQQEIDHRAAQDSEEQEDAYPASAHLHRVDKNRGGDSQPEQKVQKPAQYPPGDAKAQDAEEVVQHADQPAEEKGAQQCEGLPGNRYLHRRLPE